MSQDWDQVQRVTSLEYRSYYSKCPNFSDALTPTSDNVCRTDSQKYGARCVTYGRAAVFLPSHFFFILTRLKPRKEETNRRRRRRRRRKRIGESERKTKWAKTLSSSSSSSSSIPSFFSWDAREEGEKERERRA